MSLLLSCQLLLDLFRVDLLDLPVSLHLQLHFLIFGVSRSGRLGVECRHLALPVFVHQKYNDQND